jgi:hypothetical protein
MKKFLLVILTMVSITSYSQDFDSFFAVVYDLKPNTIKIEHNVPVINTVTNIFDGNVIAIYLIYNNDIIFNQDPTNDDPYQINLRGQKHIVYIFFYLILAFYSWCQNPTHHPLVLL